MFSFGGMPGGMGGHPFHQQQRAAAQPAATMKRGAEVCIHGLRSQATHNGKTGTVLSFNESKQRYTVQLGSDDKLALRPTNLTQLADGVTVTGIESHPQFNGQTGRIIGWDDSKARYRVQLGSGQAIALVPEKVILPNGTCVVLQGLNSAKHNGVRAEILSFDQGAGRYLVKTSERKQIRVKLANVKA